jgi:Cu/Ag efflux pump CusA
LTAAKLLSQVAEINPALLREHLPAEVLAYLRGKEPDFGANLSDTALEALAMAVLKQTSWAQLVNQAGFQKAGIQSLLDLNKLNGGSVAGTLNVLVDLKTPPALDSFKVRIIDGLTPEAVLYLTKQEPGFLTALKPEVLRAMSAITLKSLPESFWGGLADATLKSDLTAIADGSKPSAATTLNGSDGGASTMTDDPNAPQLPDNWKQAPGMNLKTAQDFLKKPYGLSAGAFLNAAGASPQGGAALLSTLGPDVLLYIQAHDPTFFDALDVATLNMLTKETLQKLPQSVQDRVSGPVFVPKETVTRADGQNSQILTVNKASDANTVKVYHGILDLFDRVRAANPEIQISVILEMSSFIEESIAGVAREGGLGAIMAVIVILLFLNFSVRSTIVTAVSIPTSVAMAFMLMRWVPGNVHTFLMQPGIISALPESIHNFLLALFPASITLNIMTLSGLTVAIGRVVDDSIVVLENIYRQLQKGTPRREAIIKGTRDVSLAIFAATTTTIIVFLPIGLTGGIVGQVFLPFGMAVTYALASSFVVAITLVPLLAYLFVDPKTLPEEKEGQLGKTYHGLLTWSLNHRAAVLLIAVVSLVIGLIIFAQRPTTFIPPLGDPRIAVNVSMPSGTSLAQTDARVREFEKYIESQKSNGVARYQVTVGSGGGYEDIMAALGGSKTINGAAASITVAVDVSGDALIALTQDVRAKANALFGEKNVKVSKATISEQGFGGFALVLSGPEATLRQLNDKVIKTLSGVPGMTNVSSSLSQVGDATSYLRVNRTAAISYGAELEVNDTLGATSKAIEAVKAIPDLPSDVKISQGFTSEIQTQGFSQTFSAMGIAVVAVYVVMVLTFGSLVHPFTILFSLPLAVVGAAVGLWVTNRVVGISALVGLLMLIGIVVTNAIVMIDRVQQNRREKHLAPREALVEGARTRLRPILMTAIATMFALLPLAIGVSQGAIIASELGTVVIGGLFSSTILTLLVVPVVFSMVDALQRRLTGKKVKEPGVAEA